MEIGRLEVEMCGFRIRGWRSVGLKVEIGRFRGGDVWV